MPELNSTRSTVDLLLSRRSVVAANITLPGPNDDELKQILSAGLRVPDHGKLAPWRIQVLGKNMRERLVAKQSSIFASERSGESPKKLELLNKTTLGSPVLLVVTSRPNSEKFEKVPLLEQQISGGALCQNILVAAHSMGYVGQWLTAWPAYHPEIKQCLGHSDKVDILGFIHLGSPASSPSERDRPDFQDIVSYLD